MYRVVLESVLGLRLEGGTHLEVRPCIPDEWSGYKIAWQLPVASGTRIELSVQNPQRCSAAVVGARFDGEQVEVVGGAVRVTLPGDGGTHRLEITLGPGR